jgi:DNA-binding NtrC family response regulator
MLCGPTEARIVITGETGTGKTSIARALHFMHPTRGARNFRRTNIGALVPELAASQLFGHVKGAFTGAERDHKGIVEESNLGTLFLDEVSTAADVVQVMLLTLLENNTVNRVGAEPGTRPIAVDVRFIAATTMSLTALQASTAFRKDLFFRLAEYHIHLPPLRECKEDIEPLALSFLEECHATHRTDDCARLQTIEPAAMDRLVAADWPGKRS